MENMIEQVKNAFWIALTFCLGHFTNVSWSIGMLFAGFMLNIFIGIGADVHSGDKEFKMRKATEGVKLLMFYVVIVFFLYAITYKNPPMSDTIVNWLTYIVSYFYLTNVFRNAKIIFPKSEGVKFIYDFLSTEIFYRLKEYIGWHRKNREEEDNA